MASESNVVAERELIRKRGSVKSKLNSSVKFIDPCEASDSSDVHQLRLRVAEIEKDFDSYETIQDNLELIASDDEYEHRLAERCDFEDCYYDSVARALRLIETLEKRQRVKVREAQHSGVNAIAQSNVTRVDNVTQPTVSADAILESQSPMTISSESQVKLPTMHLPKFSGSCTAWPGFCDTFRSAVHENTAFRDTQKLIYLKSCLVGNAAEKIESLETTAADYSVAWSILEKNYDDPKVIINNRIQAFFELPSCMRANTNSFDDLVDQSTKQYRALEVLKKPFLEAFPIYAITSKLESPSFEKGYYLPHQAIIKQSSVTTKFRVVFDASAKTSSGLSLNDTMLVGPTIQDEMYSLLVRFRSHSYVLTADIEKMYRQVLIHPADRIYQKILWRADPQKPLETYTLNTVTYGTSAAPFLAIRALHQLATDEGKAFPRAAMVLREDFYVDDLLTGAQTQEEVVTIRDELIQLCRKGGFHIRQWAANHEALIECLEDKTHDKHLKLDLDATIKALGLRWNPKLDTISYSVKDVDLTKHITKRTMLSQIATPFDPLGLLGPVIIRAKILMQKLWKLQIDWDESVPLEIYSNWVTYCRELRLLRDYEVSRQITSKTYVNLQLHGFCDASVQAYGACIYLRVSEQNGTQSVHLVASKSRVAPLKTVTLPRLELCAAQLLNKLFKSTRYALRRLDFDKIIFWSDSTIALHWIKSAPHTLKTFVSHRVADIQTLTENHEWRHVRSLDNPADLISRGLSSKDFIQNGLWHHGPVWLRCDETCWPKLQLANIEIPELRTIIVLTEQTLNWNVLNRFSSFSKLKRVVAYVLRFYFNASRKEKRNDTLNAFEIIRSEQYTIRQVQKRFYYSELHALKTLAQVAGRLASLNPFIDQLPNENVNWHFISPRAPHFGGLWEAGVRATKHHLTRIVGKTLLSYKALITYVNRIEAILNPRPPAFIPFAPNVLQALTPAHFLIGDTLISLPYYDFSAVPIGRLSSWEHIQRMRKHFWYRWSKEYLQEQTVRKKCHRGEARNISIGTLLIVREDNTPPLTWPLGRIIAIHPGEDGVIRVVTVKTLHGEYKRCVKRISPLPLDN